MNIDTCPICGIEERGEKAGHVGGYAFTYEAVKLEYKGCCSKECARTLMMVRAQISVSEQLAELIVATAIDRDYIRGDRTFEKTVAEILNP